MSGLNNPSPWTCTTPDLGCQQLRTVLGDQDHRNVLSPAAACRVSKINPHSKQTPSPANQELQSSRQEVASCCIIANILAKTPQKRCLQPRSNATSAAIDGAG